MCANDVFFRVPVGMCLRSRLRAVLGRTPLKRPAAQALKRPARALEAKGGSARATAEKGIGAARPKKPGCSKCRYATYGCSACAPDLPRRKRASCKIPTRREPCPQKVRCCKYDHDASGHGGGLPRAILKVPLRLCVLWGSSIVNGVRTPAARKPLRGDGTLLNPAKRQ